MSAQIAQQFRPALEHSTRTVHAHVQVLSKARRPAAKPATPGRLLQQACGLDVVKKASTRKGRVLMLFKCQMVPIEGGRLVCTIMS